MKLITILALSFLSTIIQTNKAELHIENNSKRDMTIKVMHLDGGKYSTIHIKPWSKATEYFSKTGKYFLKTKATLDGKDPVCEKGDGFEVYVGTDGVSILTITYSITESENFNPLEGDRISLAEFEKDN